MLNLYIVRHGQTIWNTERRFQGWLDSPLTPHGVECALILKEKLAPLDFHVRISSPSPRAEKTMQLIISDEEAYHLDPRLREIRLGVWQGMTHEEIEVIYPEYLEMFYNRPEKFLMPDSESYFDVHARVKAFLQELVDTYHNADEETNVLIVTHGVTLMIFKLIFDNMPVSELGRYSVSKNVQVHHYQYVSDHFIKISDDV